MRFYAVLFFFCPLLLFSQTKADAPGDSIPTIRIRRINASLSICSFTLEADSDLIGKTYLLRSFHYRSVDNLNGRTVMKINDTLRLRRETPYVIDKSNFEYLVRSVCVIDHFRLYSIVITVVRNRKRDHIDIEFVYNRVRD